MKRVEIVNLGGRARHIESEGAAAIDAWLDTARIFFAGTTYCFAEGTNTRHCHPGDEIVDHDERIERGGEGRVFIGDTTYCFPIDSSTAHCLPGDRIVDGSERGVPPRVPATPTAPATPTMPPLPTETPRAAPAD